MKKDTRPSTPAYPAMEFRAMNTSMTIMGQSKQPLPYWQRPIFHLFENIEHSASRFLSSSELNQINEQPIGTPITVSNSLFELLQVAWKYALQTEFLFNPFVGTSLNSLGYNRSFEHVQSSREPVMANEDDGDYSTTYFQPHFLQFDSRHQSVIRWHPKKVDLGGIGKGWAVDRAYEMMHHTFEVHSGIVDAGGDLRIWNRDEPWCIGIESPDHEGKELIQFWIQNAAVATSSIAHRRWQTNRGSYHHILHGHTGLPSTSDIVQATVFASTVCDAEIVAKICCMLGSKLAFEWCERHFPQIGIFLIRHDQVCMMNKFVDRYAKIVEGSIADGTIIDLERH